MKPRVTLTYQHYVLTLPHHWSLWRTFLSTFRAEIEARKRTCESNIANCVCQRGYQVLIRRRLLSLERAIEMQHYVTFYCSLPPRRRAPRAPQRGFIQTAATHLLDLPNEMLLEIMLQVCVCPRHFRLHDVAAMASTCQRLFGVAKMQLLWRRVTACLHSYRAQSLEQLLKTTLYFSTQPADTQARRVFAEPWKTAQVPSNFGIVLQLDETSTRGIVHIRRDETGDILEYARRFDEFDDDIYRRYDISDFGWRLKTGVQFKTFFINAVYVRARPTTQRTARFEITGVGALNTKDGTAMRAFFLRYTHQLQANTMLSPTWSVGGLIN